MAIQFELRNKSFYQKTLMLMAPIIVQQLISVGINFMDNLMVGSFGETQIAAVSFSDQVYSLFQFICMGLGSGAVVLSSQFWGRKETDSIRRVSSIALRLTALLCVLFTVATVGFPQLILRAFTNETAVIETGDLYLRLVGITFLMAGLSSTATYLLRSVGQIRIPLIGSSVAFVLNVFFNWVFIFGKLGAPRLELVGAAVGTIIARLFELCFVFGYFLLRDRRIGFRPNHLLLSGGQLWRPYFRYGLPVLISDTLLGVSLALTGTIIGHMGEMATAASSIVLAVVKLVDIFSSGMAGASAVVVGNTIGQGDIPRAKREGNSYMVLSFILGLVVVIPLLLLGRPLLSLYNISDQTRDMAYAMLCWTCVWMPLQANAYMTSKGVLRGGGDTRFILVADSLLVWVFSIPVGALAGLVWHASPVLVYVILRVQFPLKGIICLVRYISGKWIQVIPSGQIQEQAK